MVNNTDTSFDQFVDTCASLENTSMQIEYQGITPNLMFSNSGQRGRKFFTISLISVIEALKNIVEKLDEFQPHSRYVEERWRVLAGNFSFNATRALAGVQTKPFFVLLAKMIHVANALSDDQYSEDHINLDRQYLLNTINYLQQFVPDQADAVSVHAVASASGSQRIGENVIVYGAPGTGKSYKLKEKTAGDVVFNTVFHPDTQYSDFVGCLRPYMDNGSVSYGYRPGPFVLALLEANRHPERHVVLQVEEINRAAAAAVFGDIFQLLDRDATGESVYAIDVTDVDMKAFIESQTACAVVNGKIKIPSNMSVLATMNSSDQSVMPLDTAFKRRWSFEYLPIDFKSTHDGSLRIPLNGSLETVPWKVLGDAINDVLKNDVPEDRLLGQWFLSAEELAATESADKALTGKLFLYLWDDVLRHSDRGLIFNTDQIGTLGDLERAFSNAEQVFSDSLEQSLVARLQNDVMEEMPDAADQHSDTPS